MKTKLFFIVKFLAVLAAFSSCVSNDAVSQVEFTIVNQTGRLLEELYCSPAFSHFQSTELLGGIALENGESRQLSFTPEFGAPYWDIIAIDIDGTEYEAAGISSLSISIVTLTDDQDESDNILSEFSDFWLDSTE
jgi:hypothetical protein